MTRRWHALLFIVVAALLCVELAHAYAPPAGYVLHLVTGRRAKQKLSGLRVFLRRTDFENGAPKGEPYEVIFTYRGDGKVRREWTDKDGRHVRVTDGQKLLRMDGDKKTVGKAEPHMMDAVWTVANEGDRDGAEERAKTVMTAWTISDTPVALTRMDGRIAWVVGAQSRQLDVPQMWVDKDEHLPLRFIYPEAPPAEGQKPVLIDEQLKAWGSAAGGEFYPGRREVYRAGQLVRVDELVKVDVTPKIDERDFKIE